MNKILFSLSGAILYTICFPSAQIHLSSPAIEQGIEGYVYYVSGNQMPSPTKKSRPPKGIKTILYIYQLTNINQVTRQGQSAFYSSVKTRLIKKTESDTTGFFSVQLDPGRYSLFTKTGAFFYANLFDKDNNIEPVEVLSRKITRTEVRIDHDATY
jgi:hypothetical protein